MIFTFLFCLGGVIRRAVSARHRIHSMAQERAVDAEPPVVEEAAKQNVRILVGHEKQKYIYFLLKRRC